MSGHQTAHLSLALITCNDTSRKPHYLIHKIHFNNEETSSQGASFDLHREDFDSLISFHDLLLDGVLHNSGNIANVMYNEEKHFPFEVLNSDTYFEKKINVAFQMGESKDHTFVTVKKVYNRDTHLFFQENLLNAREVYYEKLRRDFIQSAFKTIYGELVSITSLNTVIEELAKSQFNEKNAGHYDDYKLPEEKSLPLIT